jgi:hypothetical protein
MIAEDLKVSENRAAWIAGARLAIGLAQGLVLYFLYAAMEDGTWPAGNGFIFAPLLFLALYIPPLKLVSLGNMRLTTLIVWMFVAAFALVGLAWYDIWHEPSLDQWVTRAGHWGPWPRIVPNFGTFFFTTVAAFIAQALVAGGDADQRIVASYTTHFDVAWKLAVQLALALLFVVIFWLLLWLGAELFDLIGIDFFTRLLEHKWFAIPATSLAVAAAVHVTDVRAGLVRGARTLLLVLLSWLLPLMAIIVAGFLVGLFFTGLEPLWKTQFAAGYLLIAAGTLVILINAAYQDGSEEHRPPLLIRYAASLASLSLVPLVVIASYAIALRVEQYGWTTARIGSTACAIVAASYAIGYSAGGIWPGQWLAPIARWNFVTSLVVLAVIGALFSPIADPLRISVASQVARLESGKADPRKFDFAYLHWNGGRFGIAALNRLASRPVGPNAATVSKLAKASLAQKSQYEFQPPQPANLVTSITVYPRGRALPKSFLNQDWRKIEGSLPPCLRDASVKCDAYIFDFAGDGQEEIAVIGSAAYGGYPYGNGLFALQADGTWKLVGRPDTLWACPSIAAALQAGKSNFVAPEVPHWRDISAGGQRIGIYSLSQEGMTCPK